MPTLNDKIDAEIERLMDKIDEWHEGDSNVELHEFLGMTWEEYKVFALKPKTYVRGKLSGVE